jgi:hypothetical protein
MPLYLAVRGGCPDLAYEISGIWALGPKLWFQWWRERERERERERALIGTLMTSPGAKWTSPLPHLQLKIKDTSGHVYVYACALVHICANGAVTCCASKCTVHTYVYTCTFVHRLCMCSCACGHTQVYVDACVCLCVCMHSVSTHVCVQGCVHVLPAVHLVCICVYV